MPSLCPGIGLGKVPLMNGDFRKLTEVPVNERQKPLIFKSLMERIIAGFEKKLTTKNENGTELFLKTVNFISLTWKKN